MGMWELYIILAILFNFSIIQFYKFTRSKNKKIFMALVATLFFPIVRSQYSYFFEFYFIYLIPFMVLNFLFYSSTYNYLKEMPMGLDVSSFKFLLHKSKEAKFKNTLTLGRQNCHTSLKQLKISGWDKEYIPNYIEEICTDLFGSYPNVQSVDNSSYENATIICNMNNPINSALIKKSLILF